MKMSYFSAPFQTSNYIIYFVDILLIGVWKKVGASPVLHPNQPGMSLEDTPRRYGAYQTARRRLKQWSQERIRNKISLSANEAY
jgi:hypothetical protein